MKERLVQITTPYGACAGIIFLGETCVDAAPIFRWAIGKEKIYLYNYFQKKKWQVQEIKNNNQFKEIENFWPSLENVPEGNDPFPHYPITGQKEGER